MFKLVPAVTAAVALLAGCGVADNCACGAAPATPPIVTTPAAGFDVLITDHDRDVAVRTGQRIEVYLRANTGMTNWQGVRSDNTAVLSPIATGITAPRGVTIAGFRAVSTGEANITATAGADCYPNQACPMYAVLFSVRVTVR